MGRQVNFYMHPEDEIEFVNRRCKECRFLLTRQVTSQLDWLKEIPRFGKDSYEVFIGRPGQLSIGSARRVEGQPYCLVDASRYELVEFCRSRLDSDGLTRGRLWFDPGPTFEGTAKSEEFVRWAGSLLNWIRRHYSRNDSGFYVGQHAGHWLDKGGHLGGLWGPPRSSQTEPRVSEPARPGVIPGLPQGK